MGHRSLSSRSALALWFAGFMFIGSASAMADPAVKMFEDLKGDWKGGGTVTPMGGDPVKVACKVTYDLNGEKLSQNLRCAGEDTTIKTDTKMTDKGGKLSGSWSEAEFGRTGGLNGTVSDNTIHARISGDKFSGRMSITATSGGHAINILQLDKGSGTYRPVASIAFNR